MISNMPCYEQMKDSGVEWLGEIPVGWEVRKIKYLFKIGRGRVISQQELDELAVYPVYSSQTQDNGVLGYIHSYDFDCKQITWTTDGANAGTIFLRDGKYSCTNVCGTLKPLSEKFSLAFCEKSLSVAAQYYKRPDTNGAKIMNGEMAEIYITFPSLPEQTAIATFLDQKTAQIEQAIALKQKQIELFKERKQLVIQHAVTKGLNPNAPMRDSGVEWIGEIPEHWDALKVKLISSFILDGTHGSFPRCESGFRLLSVRNIVNSEFVLREDDSFVSKKHFSEISSKFLIQKDDIQLAIVGATLGKVAITPAFTEKVVTQRSVCTIRVKPQKCLNKYLYFFMRSFSFQSYLWSSAGFSAQPGVYLGTIQNAYVSLPPINEQTAIIAHIETQSTKIDKAINIQQQQINKLKEYKATLINSAVTGKIKVL